MAGADYAPLGTSDFSSYIAKIMKADPNLFPWSVPTVSHSLDPSLPRRQEVPSGGNGSGGSYWQPIQTS